MAKFRPGTLRVLTANDLLTGDVVFLTDQGTWSRILDEARLAGTQEEAAKLDALAANAQVEALTVAAYTIDVERGAEGRLRPLRTRELIRISGPLTRLPLKTGRRKSDPEPEHTAAIGVLMPPRGNGDDHVSL